MAEQNTGDQPSVPALGVTLEDIGPARKCLTIEVPEERISQKMESNYSQLQTDAVIPGFRKGRVPRKLIEKRFGSALREDTRKQLIGECYTQAIEQEKLDVLGEPDVKDLEEIKLPESGPLSFKVEVEVSPDVALPDLTQIPINKTPAEVTDDAVDQEVTRLCERFGEMEEAPDGVVQEEDYVKADVRILAGKDAKDDAQEIKQHTDTWIVVHGKQQDYKGHAAGIVVEKLGKQLIKKKAGDRVAVSLTGPASHEDERIKDQPITMRIQINAVERVKPIGVEDLVERWGAESPDQLRQKLREMLEDRAQREQKADMHKQVNDYLMQQVQLELPEGMTSRQTERLLHRRKLDLVYRNSASEQEVEAMVAQMREESEEEAINQLKQFFIMDKAAKALAIDVSQAEVNGRIAMMAMQDGRRPEKLRQEMVKRGEIEYLYLQIREQKTLDKILESAKITEVKPTDKGDTQEASSGQKTGKKKRSKPKSAKQKAGSKGQ